MLYPFYIQVVVKLHCFYWSERGFCAKIAIKFKINSIQFNSHFKMNLHEYQAKHLLQHYGITTPIGEVVQSEEAAVAATKEIGGGGWVIKAQVHAGGRGKAGGVKLVKSAQEAQSVASALLGKHLITYQNAPDGQPVHQILVEQPCRLRASCIVRCWLIAH